MYSFAMFTRVLKGNPCAIPGQVIMSRHKFDSLVITVVV